MSLERTYTHSHHRLDSTSEGGVDTIITIRSDPPSLSNLVECTICLEAYSPKDMSQSPLDCAHSFCKNCLKEYIKTQIESYKVLAIRCPQESCECKITDKTIKLLLDEKTYKIYETITLKKLALSDQKHRLCPMPGCTLKISISRKSPKSKCKCGGTICNSCGSQWHEGKTCLESIDTAFQVYSSEHEIKFCIVCKTTVNRTEGCKHITCPICDFEWCWDCGRQHTTTHSQMCPGKWDPLPPSKPKSKSWKEKWNKSSLGVKILIGILSIPLWPFVLLGLLLCWPLCFSFNPSDDLSWKTPFKSLVVIIFGMLLALFFLPMVVLGLFIVICVFVLSLPFLLCYGIMECFGEKSQQETKTVHPDAKSEKIVANRWINGDPALFGYTSKSKPREDEQPDNNRQEQEVVIEMGQRGLEEFHMLDIEADYGRQDL